MARVCFLDSCPCEIDVEEEAENAQSYYRRLACGLAFAG